jgi:hypothetical protein
MDFTSSYASTRYVVLILEIARMDDEPLTPDGLRQQDLPPAARRALAEAEARRKAAVRVELPPEVGGGKGPEPTRFGDWEKKGIASDF